MTNILVRAQSMARTDAWRSAASKGPSSRSEWYARGHRGIMPALPVKRTFLRLKRDCRSLSLDRWLSYSFNASLTFSSCRVHYAPWGANHFAHLAHPLIPCLLRLLLLLLPQPPQPSLFCICLPSLAATAHEPLGVLEGLLRPPPFPLLLLLLLLLFLLFFLFVLRLPHSWRFKRGAALGSSSTLPSALALSCLALSLSSVSCARQSNVAPSSTPFVLPIGVLPFRLAIRL